MRKIVRILLSLFGFFIIIASINYNSTLERNNRKINSKLSEAELENGQLEDIFNMGYDKVHIFTPETKKEEIKNITGFNFRKWKPSSEGEINILFTFLKQGVCYLHGDPKNLGYDLDFKDKAGTFTREEFEKIKFKALKDEKNNIIKYETTD